MAKTSKARADLLQQLEETLRRVGAQSVLLSDTVATIVGLNSTDLECLDLLEMAGPTTAGRLGTCRPDDRGHDGRYRSPRARRFRPAASRLRGSSMCPRRGAAENFQTRCRVIPTIGREHGSTARGIRRSSTDAHRRIPDQGTGPGSGPRGGCRLSVRRCCARRARGELDGSRRRPRRRSCVHLTERVNHSHRPKTVHGCTPEGLSDKCQIDDVPSC